MSTGWAWLKTIKKLGDSTCIRQRPKGAVKKKDEATHNVFKWKVCVMKTMRRPNSQTTISDKTFESKDPTFHEG
mgnify:CR=1 FL=1